MEQIEMQPQVLKRLMAKFPCTELANGNIRTCPVRLSYPHLFKKHKSKKYPNAEPKFSATLLFPKGADISVLQRAAADKKAEVFGNAKGKVNMPFLDQGQEVEQPGYTPGAVMLRCNASETVGVKRRNLTDADEKDVYPGVWALVTVRPFASTEYGRVSFGLQNVMILADDEPLAGGRAPSADEDFADANMEEDAELLAALETGEPAEEYDFG